MEILEKLESVVLDKNSPYNNEVAALYHEDLDEKKIQFTYIS